MQLIQRFEMISRGLCTQLLTAAKTIPHRSRIQTVAARADEVVLAVADHQGGGRVQTFFGHQVSKQLDLIGAGTVQFTAVDHLEMFGEIKMPGNLTGENPWFGGRDIQLAALPAEGFQQRCNPVEDPVFIQSGDLEALTVKIHRLPGLGLVEVVKLHEGLQQWRTNKVFKPGKVGLVDPQFGQGELNRAGDALARVGQRAIKVEQNVLVMHVQS